ncbi:MAG: NADH-quinone oxidoreductase subunit D [Cyanobacteriota bacterium]
MEQTIMKDFNTDTLTINVGPQHPSTHGVLRLKMNIEGEIILESEAIIGYLHRGKEKLAESRPYFNYLPMVDRVDYVSSAFCLSCFCYAVERLAKLKVPKRAEYIRLILMELNRIASHLIFVSSFLLDMGATSILFYCFRDREKILKLLEEVTGARMMYNYFRFSGVKEDLPHGWCDKVKELCDELPKYFAEYEAIINKNPIVIARTVNQGIITAEEGINYGITGPNIRASGVNLDLRKTNPYSVYREVPFEVILGNKGDALERYKVRVKEMYESAEMIKKALELLPGGPTEHLEEKRNQCGCKKEDCEVCGFDTQVLGEKINPIAFKPPAGEIMADVEAPRGILSCYVISDGTNKPYRVKWRTGSFSSVQYLPALIKGHMFADVMPIFGSLDVVLPEVDR